VIHLLENASFEKFSVYKFSISYPSVCRVEFNPKSRRESGDVVFHFPDKEKVFLSWGDLEKVQKRFSTVEEQAEHGIKTVSKSGAVKGCERVVRDSIEVNSHKAAYNHIRLKETVGGGLFGSSAMRELIPVLCDLRASLSQRPTRLRRLDEDNDRLIQMPLTSPIRNYAMIFRNI
jgi:hypothetical protein